MEIYNSSGRKQTWHQNEATPRESRRNAPTREQMRLFASNIKKLQQERVGAPSCGWTGEGGTLQRLCSPYLSPMRGVGEEQRRGSILPKWLFRFFSLLYKHVKMLLELVSIIIDCIWSGKLDVDADKAP